MLDDQKLFLDTGNGPPGIRGDLGDRFYILSFFSRRAAYADGADAVRAIAEQEAEIVFLGDVRDTRLCLTEPPFRAEMLKEGMDALRPLMLALQDGKAASDLSPPLRRIDKTCPSAGRLLESAGDLVFG